MQENEGLSKTVFAGQSKELHSSALEHMQVIYFKTKSKFYLHYKHKLYSSFQ